MASTAERNTRMMNQTPNSKVQYPTIAVIGMGYVGAVSATALAQRGCRVVGVEVNPQKLALLRAGQSPVREPQLDEQFAQVVSAGRFTATDNLADAGRDADIIMVAVGTPSRADGQVDLSSIDRVTQELAAALRERTSPCVVLIRSTVPPGTTRDRIAPLIKQANRAAVVGHHPEFLREGTAMADWHSPSMIVWGADGNDTHGVARAMESLYAGIEAPRLPLGTAESELMKYACNVFHAVKIDFANEIGSLAAACGADPQAVMNAFCQDRKLNVSPAYLRPGFAFGGSCLPKDTRAVLAMAARHNLQLPLMEGVLASNQAHLSRQVERVLIHGRRPTLLLGLSFKEGTDDLRESPMVELAERLLGKGVPLSIYDADLKPSELLGANARYIQTHLPHLNMLLRNELEQAVREAEVVVIGKRTTGATPTMLRGKTVIDLCAGPAVVPAADFVARQAA